MIFDLLSEENFDLPKFDVCVIGSGPAGMTLALELEKKDKKVLLSEAGGENFSKESEDCYKGKVIGDKYVPLDVSRLRFLGGSSNHWGGMCRPLDDIDFKSDPNISAEWPIEKKDLDLYLNKACSILEISDSFADKIISEKYGIKEISFNNSPPVIFKNKYYQKLKKSKNIFVLLNSNLVDMKPRNDEIYEVDFKSFNNKSIVINADNFVLATGGIENSRLLKWFNSIHKGSIVDSQSPVGNYWMEHPHFTLGSALLEKWWESRYMSLTENKIRELGVLNAGIKFEGLTGRGSKRLVKELLCVAPKLGKKAAEYYDRNLICGVKVRAAWEQQPRYDNRIELSKTDKDSLGIPLTTLFWKKNPLDLKTIQKTILHLNKWIMSSKFGRLQLSDWVLGNDDYPENDELGGMHHMGGTRMSNSPINGVVNKDLKVFKMKNLFICGSSVFPTGGHANPTLTIVQLSLRLANHLSSK